MAKRRRVNQPSAKAPKSAPRADVSPGKPPSLQPALIALGLLGGAIVYVTYYPSDSVSVEKGEALWFSFLAIAIATVTLGLRFQQAATQPATQPENADDQHDEQGSRQRRLGILVDLTPWLLAVWMMFAAFSSSPPGNLRLATNEAWLWVAGAALFTAARRLLESIRARQAVLLLLIVGASALAVHGMHQYLISLPNNRIEYERDPERILQLAGVDAPEGSSERMVFENRLFDGGPTGTFALANSLAAVLLVGIIGATGVLRLRWSSLNIPTRIAWGCLLLLCVGCLMAARSRSATLAMLLGVTLVFVVGSRLRQTKPAVVLKGLAAIAAIGLLGALGLALFGNPEWFEEAPASLAFRFQYWRSTWQLALDRPWLGAGPGNFQSIYERYREASATEQIAEPHNFLFETLASGGFIALALLMVLIACGVLFTCSQWQRRAADGDVADGDVAADGQAVGRWLWLGAGLGLSMVWLIGLATRSEPDLEAHLFAVPVAVFFAALLWSSVTGLSSRDLDLISGIMLVALMVHLLVAGGWTVPGIAIAVWLLSALLTRTDASETGSSSQLGQSVVAAAFGLLLLGLIYFLSLQPVGASAAAMSMAEYSQRQQRVANAKIALEEAMVADPWAVDPALWMADFCRWQLVLGEDTPPLRQNWESSLSEVKRRAGDDPAVFRIVGGHQLHVFQRYRQSRDLVAAAETFQWAADWSPANQWLAAQVAVIADARGQAELAGRMATIALELSKLGGNIERSLERQKVYAAEFVGSPAKRGPVRRPASELLTNQLDAGSVEAHD